MRYASALTASPTSRALPRAMKNLGSKLSPFFSPLACLMPPFIWKSSTLKPSKPASRRALRYSVTYIPKRHGPHEPAVRNTCLSMMSSVDIPCRSRSSLRYFTRLPTVK